MVLLVPLINGVIGLGLVFIACEIGQILADAFDKINFTIDQLDWYLFPKDIQRMLPMIIEIAQESVSLECFGSISCGREVFKSVSIKQFNKQ